MILKNGKRIDGCSDTVPIGVLSPFLGLTPPNGYLVCQGQLVSKTTYPELYAICGNLFGTATDTHFYLPDLRGKTVVGYNSSDTSMNTIGKLLGSATHIHSTGNHTLTIDEIPNHSHNVDNYCVGAPAGSSREGEYYTLLKPYGSSVVYPLENAVTNTGGGQAHNHGDTGSATNYQPSLTANWIVKAAMLIPDYFIVENTLESDNTQNALSAAQGKVLNDNITQYSTYSTEETAIGVWTNEDGTKQTLYRKIVYLGNLPNASHKNIPHNIDNLKMITKFYGTFYSADYSSQASLPYVVSNENSAYFPYQIDMDINQTDIVLIAGVDRSTYKGQVTIEYTKN